jgi:hypothetical protein
MLTTRWLMNPGRMSQRSMGPQLPRQGPHADFSQGAAMQGLVGLVRCSVLSQEEFESPPWEPADEVPDVCSFQVPAPAMGASGRAGEVVPPVIGLLALNKGQV